MVNGYAIADSIAFSIIHNHIHQATLDIISNLAKINSKIEIKSVFIAMLSSTVINISFIYTMTQWALRFKSL